MLEDPEVVAEAGILQPRDAKTRPDTAVTTFVPRDLDPDLRPLAGGKSSDAEGTTEGTIRLMPSRSCLGYEGTRFGYPSLGRGSKRARKARGSQRAPMSGRGVVG